MGGRVHPLQEELDQPAHPRFGSNAEDRRCAYHMLFLPYSYCSALTQQCSNAYVHSLQFNEVATVRRGWNVDPPAVAVVFNGWVSKTGSVLGDDVFAPMWPDTENITSFREQYFPTAPNQVKPLAHTMSSSESLCISIAMPFAYLSPTLVPSRVCVNRPQRTVNGGR
jgi:hypothetical protein